mmetsp:Transcript_75253/g.166230  ORF Transcript_75253/g.166230 Transcript_75253/m.166230 type:complete len:202 (-) Transcript_75253:522-1127(-)
MSRKRFGLTIRSTCRRTSSSPVPPTRACRNHRRHGPTTPTHAWRRMTGRSGVACITRGPARRIANLREIWIHHEQSCCMSPSKKRSGSELTLESTAPNRWPSTRPLSFRRCRITGATPRPLSTRSICCWVKTTTSDRSPASKVCTTTVALLVKELRISTLSRTSRKWRPPNRRSASTTRCEFGPKVRHATASRIRIAMRWS